MEVRNAFKRLALLIRMSGPQQRTRFLQSQRAVWMTLKRRRLPMKPSLAMRIASVVTLVFAVLHFYRGLEYLIGGLLAAQAVLLWLLSREMATLERHLARREWMLGSTFSIVNYCVGKILAGLAASHCQWPALRAVRASVDRVHARAGWRTTNSRY
jgi:glutathione S-transferase